MTRESGRRSAAPAHMGQRKSCGDSRLGCPVERSEARGQGTQARFFHFLMVPSKGLEPPHRCRYMDLNHARLPIPPRWQSELQCSGGRKAAVSGRLTYLFLQPAISLSNHRRVCLRPEPEPEARPTPASPSSKSSRSAPSTRDSPSPPPPHTSETPPHPPPEPSPPHRCGSP